jgi:hypothetical protein
MYPKRKYHARGGGSIVVSDQHHERAVGPEWLDNPPSGVHEGDELLQDLETADSEVAENVATNAATKGRKRKAQA